MKNTSILTTIGREEYITFPDFNTLSIRAKIDTGANSSSIHATHIQPFLHNGREKIRFHLHPNHHDIEEFVVSEASLLTYRNIKSSNGQKQLRPVIQTHLQLGAYRWPIELNLSDRQGMSYRMLLGSKAIKGRFLVDVSQSFLQS